tara:strand:- start:403 stop:561 length:159 start_codon:yes stop_codon:yes gene_type:complete
MVTKVINNITRKINWIIFFIIWDFDCIPQIAIPNKKKQIAVASDILPGNSKE